MTREPDFVDECYARKDLSLLKKLTLVIPTYNRKFYLSRCLWYHAHFPFGEIIVADSSPEEKKVVNRETIAKIREKFGANIRYLEYETETDKYGGDIHQKWGDAVHHVTTDYSMSCTDKEFLIPTTLCHCVAFLEENTDYVIAEGEDYMMDSFTEDEIGFYPWQGVVSFDEDTIEKRLRAYLSYEITAGTQFAVMRAVCQKQIYANLKNYEIADIRFGETAVELQPLLFGKTKRFVGMPANCRDVTHVRKYSALYTRTDKSESSYIRYPSLQDYPQERYATMSKKAADCFMNVWNDTLDDGSNCPESIKEMVSEYIVPLMDKRYGPSHKLIKKYAIIRIIWNRFPTCGQIFLSRTLGEGNVIPESAREPAEETQEMYCISHIVMGTNKYNLEEKLLSHANIL